MWKGSKIFKTLDELLDGSIFGRVKKSELINGQVKHIRAANNQLTITGDDIKDLIDNGGQPIVFKRGGYIL